VSNELEWIGQYRAALNEADASKRLTRIDEAERTLKQALRRAIEKGDSEHFGGASSLEPTSETDSGGTKRPIKLNAVAAVSV
jgi:hypothetical protein